MPQACVLAVIAGYADTVGFLRFDAFAGLMTGNTILLGISLANAQLVRAAVYGAIIGTFLAGVLLSRALLQLGAAQWMALTVTSALHVACGFLGRRLAALLLALAMGMQNAAATRFGGVSLNTVFITGNLQKLGEGLVAWLWHRRSRAAPPSDGVAIFGLVWLSYALGALLGAIGDAFLTYPLLVPAAVLPFVYAPFWRLMRRSEMR
ncbi:MAG TPA: YoaK family protein [Stellaceae bacterium]|nr:YoaK family protein [Stellaceae bacterium]